MTKAEPSRIFSQQHLRAIEQKDYSLYRSRQIIQLNYIFKEKNH